jgi:hypothetical protein
MLQSALQSVAVATLHPPLDCPAGGGTTMLYYVCIFQARASHL